MAAGRDLRNITREDRRYFHGWHVCLKRAGERHERYFHDHGDRRRSLARARRWRDALAARLPPPRKFKRRYRLNKTGVIGVHLAPLRTRGSRLFRYCATWIDAAGHSRKRSFSIAKYGPRKARALAVQARRRAIEELLRPWGR